MELCKHEINQSQCSICRGDKQESRTRVQVKPLVSWTAEMEASLKHLTVEQAAAKFGCTKEAVRRKIYRLQRRSSWVHQG